MYRDASHLCRSFSHNRTKIYIQFLNEYYPLVGCDHPCDCLFISTHAETTVHSYKNLLSDICKNGQYILVRMDSYFRVNGDLRAIDKYVEHVDQ